MTNEGKVAIWNEALTEIYEQRQDSHTRDISDEEYENETWNSGYAVGVHRSEQVLIGLIIKAGGTPVKPEVEYDEYEEEYDDEEEDDEDAEV